MWLAPFYFGIAIVLAVAGNVARVTTVALAAIWQGADLAEGWRHELLGYTTLGIAGALLLSFDRLLVTVLHPVEFTSDAMLDNPIARIWNFLVSDVEAPDAREAYGSFANDASSGKGIHSPDWFERLISLPATKYGLGAVAGVLIAGSCYQLLSMQSRVPAKTLYSSNALFAPSEDLFGSDYEFFQFSDHSKSRDGDDPRLGENADLWQVNIGGMKGQVVLSQPYSGWHELCVCYQNLEWDLVDRDVIDDPEIKVIENGDSDESYVTARFTRVGGQQGYLMFSAISYDGSIPSSPGSFGAFGMRLMGRLDRNGIVDQTDIMMFQFWLPTPKKLAPKVLRKLQADFVKARAMVAKTVVEPGWIEKSSGQEGSEETSEQETANYRPGRDPAASDSPRITTAS